MKRAGGAPERARGFPTGRASVITGPPVIVSPSPPM